MVQPQCFAQPANGTFGSCGVGTVRGPGLTTFDFNVSKTFKITERHAVDLRAEFINLTNHPILNAPNTSVGTQLGLLNQFQSIQRPRGAVRI